MLMFSWMIILLLLMVSLMIFMKFNKHILLILMSMEFFVVVMFYMWFVYFNMVDLNYFLSLYYLIFAVNESVLGLSIMIIIMRSNGNDYLTSMNLIKW
nr:NADH dehydrogenase subunit 4L [Syrista sp. 1 GYN-2021c]